MTSAVGRQFPGSRPQSHKEDPHRDSSTAWRARSNPVAENNNRGKRSTPDGAPLLSQTRLREQQADVDQIPLGKLQVMEKFFTPVELNQGIRAGGHVKGEHAGTGHHHRPRPHRSHRHHPHHSHQQHPHHQQQEPQWVEDQEGLHGSHAGQDVLHHHHGHHSQDHHHQHRHHLRYEHHHHEKSHHSADVTSNTCSRPHTSAAASSSIHSSGSSSSSSSSSWSSEASMQNEAFLVDNRCKLHHTLHSRSCTDISKGKRAFGEEDDEEDTRPLLSDDYHLYRSASLERSLASKDNLEIPESRKPKKAVSSIQLPTKSILKNKQGQSDAVGKAGNFRKAKSMEVLSSRNERTGPGTSKGGVGRPINEKDLELRKEEARQNLVKEKLQFSAFLNEISRQVLSPARLSSLGVTNAQRPANAGSTSPKLPREERRGQGCRQEEGKQRQQTNRPSSADSMASSAHSHCSGYSRSSQHQPHHHHGNTSGSPQLQCHTSGSHTDASTSPENSPSQEQGQGLSGGTQHRGGSNNLQTDGTNTSPELSPCLPRHHSHHTRSHGHHQYNYSAQHSPPHHPKQAHHSPSHKDVSPGTPVTPERESHSSRLDSPRNIASPEPRQAGHMVTEVQYKDVMSEAHRLQILQKQNEDLHHTLLQTALRMECMEVAFKTNHQQLEVDLQRTQLELENLKDKFTRLQDNYSSTQQTNQLLEQKIQSVSQSMGGERECLSKRILELTEQMATAQTVQSLEIINVPSLFQETSGKGFEAEEAANQFLLPVAPPPTQFMDNDHYNKIIGTGDNQALGPVLEEEESDWLVAGEGLQQGPGGGQRSVTAFLPWKQEQGSCVGLTRDRKGEGDAGSESGRDEGVRRHPPHSLQIPHLQFTMHPETLPVPTADLSLARFRNTPNSPAGQGYRVAAMHKLGSPIRVLSASLEEICSTGVRQHQPGPATLKCTEAMMNLHHPEGGALGDSDEDDLLCSWGKGNNRGKGGGAGGVGDSFEPGACLLNYHAAPRMVSHLVCQLQPMEVKTQGWTGEVTEEVLNGERTQL
ncbi:uncharacterized protein LOC135262843 isoform X2 [Anguilla rostrata]|uniref:uncharacterized protein LOC135262843 isoform X2 n=1 Tax=Anguilla rostrata TaxID=7938 RepID=UPI0030CAF7CC